MLFCDEKLCINFICCRRLKANLKFRILNILLLFAFLLSIKNEIHVVQMSSSAPLKVSAGSLSKLNQKSKKFADLEEKYMNTEELVFENLASES